MPWGVECSLGVNLGQIIQAYTKMCMKTLIQGFKDALIWIWKGSVIKLLWQDILAFLIIYFSLSILYWQVLFYDEASAQYFEMICIYCER